MKEKKRVALLFGGQSEEHPTSIESAKGVIDHLNREKYHLVPIGIDRKGEWHFFEPSFLTTSFKKGLFPTFKAKDPNFPLIEKRGHPTFFSPLTLRESADLIFPLLHGPYGEDGTIQGLLKLAHLPYVGSNHLSSAISMDKTIMKALLKERGLPIANYLTLHQGEIIDHAAIIDTLSLPLFVKPANYGSSIGISKVKTAQELALAIEKAFSFDRHLILEEAIVGRELECSILGNDHPRISLPGEVIPKGEFFDHKAKMLYEKGATFLLPAPLSPLLLEELQFLALETFKLLRCSGMARVDFLLSANHKLFINELNTIPGFSSSSLYPKLWEISGLSYEKLVDTLIECAFERYLYRS